MRKTALLLVSVLVLVLGLSSHADAAKAPYKVTLRTSAAKSSAGAFVTVSGHVTGPKAAGHTVTIQRHYVGGPWVTVATATISSRGNYRARVETPRGGTTSFRAVKGRSSVRSAGVSPTKSIPVYEWLYLASQNGFYGGDVLPGQVATIGGKTYTRSIGLSTSPDVPNPAITYKLGYACTVLSTVADYQRFSGSSTGQVANLAYAVNPGNGGPSIPTTAPITQGTPKAFNVSLVGGKYLSVGTANLQSGYTMMLGDPRVYCNADHLPSWTGSDF